MRAEHIGHRIAGVFGMQDIDFPERPEFSRRYLLRGSDEGGIRAVFTPTVQDFFEAYEGIGAASSGQRLYLWRGIIAAPDEVETLMAMAIDLRRRLSAQNQ